MTYKNLVTEGKRVSASTLIFLERFPAAVTTCHLRRGAIWGLLVKGHERGRDMGPRVVCSAARGSTVAGQGSPAGLNQPCTIHHME